jgi:hypothetical protein
LGGLATLHALLNVDGALQGAVDASKISQESVTRVLDDPAAMLGHGWPDHLVEQGH